MAIFSSFHNKTWTVNILIDTKYIVQKFLSHGRTGQWERPEGNSSYWGNHVRMIGVSDHDDGIVNIGNADPKSTGNPDNGFSINVRSGEEIQWVASPMDPFFGDEEHYRYDVALYGFDTGKNWDGNLTEISSRPQPVGSAYVFKGFNAKSKPSEKWYKSTSYKMSTPQTEVEMTAKTSVINYHTKIVLFGISPTGEATAIGYYTLDPTIKITL